MLSGFPTVLGVIDGTRIKIRNPGLHGEDFIGRKGVPTLNVQVRKHQLLNYHKQKISIVQFFFQMCQENEHNVTIFSFFYENVS